MTNPTPFDNRELRHTLGKFATGITVISVIDEAGKFWGLTVNSFSSVSLDPPLVLWSLALETVGFVAFRDAKRFAVNILAEDQIAVSERFASCEPDKFIGINVTAGLGGVPLLDGCVAVLECQREAAYPGGDHIILLGRVERLHSASRPPLIFYESRYVKLGDTLLVR
jgi:flavin reductase (DIM6/NTAB) family NADH-FMN oxidoreductase RutF